MISVFSVGDLSQVTTWKSCILKENWLLFQEAENAGVCGDKRREVQRCCERWAGAKAPGELEPQVHQPLSRLRDVIHASSYFSLLSCSLLVILHITSSKNFPQKPPSKLSSSVLFFHHTVHLFLNLRALSTVANYTFFPMPVCLLLVSPIIKLKATQEQEAGLVLLMLVFLALSLMSGTY